MLDHLGGAGGGEGLTDISNASFLDQIPPEGGGWGWRADRWGSHEERENKSPERMPRLNEIAGREQTQVSKGFSSSCPISQREGENTNIKILGSFCIWGTQECASKLWTLIPHVILLRLQHAEAFYNWTSSHSGYSSSYLNSSIWKAER